MSGQKMVAVYQAAGELEAQIIRGLLESNGVPCLLKSRAAPSVHVFSVDGMGEVNIMVWEAMAKRAERLIKGESKDYV